MANGHGGPRPNSGRPRGSSAVKRLDPETINAGILPLEMRLKVARKLWAEATDKATGEITDLAKAKEAADFAEPALQYTSPRLSSIAHTGPTGEGPVEVDHRNRIDREIDELFRAHGANPEKLNGTTAH